MTPKQWEQLLEADRNRLEDDADIPSWLIVLASIATIYGVVALILGGA